MSTVELMGLVRAQKKAARKATEADYHQRNEFTRHSFVTQDKSGRCYTYRGVEYCYR